MYYDCDPGIDDSLALAYLLASPEVALVGVGTVSGNCDARTGARNALDLLALGGRGDVPVAVGAMEPLAGAYDGGVPHIHGGNGVGDIDLPASGATPASESAVELLLRLSHEHAGSLEILAVGPLTNLAQALSADPTLPSRIRQVLVMGGAVRVPGNISPVTEANIGNDAEAARAVVAADWDLVLVPLDVTMENTLEETDRQALLASTHPLPQALGSMLDLYFDFYVAEYGRRMSALHDPLAAGLLVGGVTATYAPAVGLEVDATSGPGRGQTIADLRGQRLGPADQPGRRTRVVLATDRPFGPVLMERLLTVG